MIVHYLNNGVVKELKENNHLLTHNLIKTERTLSCVVLPSYMNCKNITQLLNMIKASNKL